MALSKHTLFLTIGLLIAQGTIAQDSEQKSINIKLVRDKFATISNKHHQENRIGYRFFEHEPIAFGAVPLSESEANLDQDANAALLDEMVMNEDVFVYIEEIKRSEHWSRQDWTYHMLPVEDGVEIVLEIKTYGEGLPEYYGVQQCFRMSGKTNIDWRRTVAETPAFSEYDQWENIKVKKSLTHVLQPDGWNTIPASENTLGIRTYMGLAIDDLRTEGDLPGTIGPYKAEMLADTGPGLIARTDINREWVSAIYWNNTSHVTDHHPADCLHSIVNIGNIPPYSSRIVRGKIYWFEGSLTDLQHKYQKDFVDARSKKLSIASCQFPVSGDIQENAKYIKVQMKEAKIRGAEVAHFPECALSGYGGADFETFDNFDWVQLKNSTSEICALAKDLDLWVLLGSSHQLSTGNKPHNSLYVISPDGKVVDRYDKRFCTSGDLDFYSPGDHFVNFKINDINCGLLICYDVRFPELYREYSKSKAEMIFQSFYNARHGEDCIHPKIMPVTAQVRAASNSFFMSLTNSSAAYSWPCHFITPDGLVMKKLPANKPGIMISEIDVNKKYYDGSGKYRLEAIDGKLNNGTLISDPKSTDRTGY